MNLTDFISKIQNILALGRIEESINELSLVVKDNDNELYNSLLIILNNYIELKNNNIKGVLSLDEYGRSRNMILFRILEIVDEIKNGRVELSGNIIIDTTKEPFNLDKITKLLLNGEFTKSILIQYCSTQRAMKKIKKKIIESEVKKVTIVQLLVYELDKFNLIEDFLAWAKKIDIQKYSHYEPYFLEEVTDSPESENYLSKVLNKYKEHLPDERPPKILIAGAYGTGKSTTVNRILNKKVAVVSHDRKGSFESTEYLWDTENLFLVDNPGLGENDENDKKTIIIYKEWVKKVDGIVVIIAAPRPFSTGAVRTIDFLISEGIPSNHIIFGLNKLDHLRYDDEDGDSIKIQFDEYEGPVRRIDKILVDKLKINFVNELNERYPSSPFKVEQVIAYDSISGWNIEKLLLSVVEVLPYQAIRRFRMATDAAIDRLEKKLKKEKKRNGGISDFRTKSTQIEEKKAIETIVAHAPKEVARDFLAELGQGFQKLRKGDIIDGIIDIVKAFR